MKFCPPLERSKPKFATMKALGIIIIIAGLLMFIFPRFAYTNEEKVADATSVTKNKKEDTSINWPAYSAGVAIIAGVIVLLAEKKKG
jgi:uncharacterized membrane protein HdeD (DUF308 family)